MAEIQHLKAFLAVAEELNFHRAADRMGVVQPALSRSIRQLEEHLDVALFERTTRHVNLTEAGKAFVPEVRSVLAQLVHAEQAVRDVKQGRAGTLNLAYMDFAVHALLPGLVSAISATAPSLRISLVYLASAQQRLALIDGRIDAGIMIGEMTAPGISVIPLASLPLTAVMSTRHRLARKRVLRIEDIRDEDILLGSQEEWSAFRDIVFRIFAIAGATPNIAFEASSAGALIGLTRSGLGMTFYAGRPHLYMNNSIALRPIRPMVKVPVNLVLRRGFKQHAVVASIAHASKTLACES